MQRISASETGSWGNGGEELDLHDADLAYERYIKHKRSLGYRADRLSKGEFDQQWKNNPDFRGKWNAIFRTEQTIVTINRNRRATVASVRNVSGELEESPMYNI